MSASKIVPAVAASGAVATTAAVTTHGLGISIITAGGTTVVTVAAAPAAVAIGAIGLGIGAIWAILKD